MAQSLVKLGGNLVVGTVPYRAGRDFGTDRFDLSTGIVYRRLPVDPGECEEAVRIGAE